MKLVLKFYLMFAFSLVLNINSFVNAQNCLDNNDVFVFFNALNELDSFYNDSLGWQKDFTNEEIFGISKKWYNAVYHSPVEYSLYFEKLHKEWEKNVKADFNKYLLRRPGLQLGRLNRKITEYTSPSFSELLRVPYLFRIKVKWFSDSKYYSEDLKTNMIQTDMFVEIEDILKGKEYFEIGDNLKISFLSLWFHGATEEQYFKIDSTYFLPVNLFRIENDTTYQYRINMLPDNEFAVYPIINEVVQTPSNFFGIGKESHWKEFKNFIIKNYTIQ
jgi:hypothetical protein